MILSSHILSEVQAVCDRILVINAGKVVADGTPQELQKQMEANNEIQIEVEGPSEQILEALSSLDHVLTAEESPGEEGRTRVLVSCEKEFDCRRAIFETVCEHGWILYEMTRTALSLEEIFLELTEEETEEYGEEEEVDESDPEERD